MVYAPLTPQELASAMADLVAVLTVDEKTVKTLYTMDELATTITSRDRVCPAWETPATAGPTEELPENDPSAHGIENVHQDRGPLATANSGPPPVHPQMGTRQTQPAQNNADTGAANASPSTEDRDEQELQTQEKAHDSQAGNAPPTASNTEEDTTQETQGVTHHAARQSQGKHIDRRIVI